MKKILLIYPPFCTPASPPYSITNLYSFLKANCTGQFNIDAIDLNLEYHKMKFPAQQKYFQDMKRWVDYEKAADAYHKATAAAYAENNTKVVKGGKPEFYKEILKQIIDQKPDVVAFSIVYSSQAFYALSLIEGLNEIKNKAGMNDILTVIGGPAVNKKLSDAANYSLNNEVELLELITDNKKGPVLPKKQDSLIAPDFSIYRLDEYFTPMPVLPVKTSTTCYYKKCAFCTHFTDKPYYEYPVEQVKEAISLSGQKLFCLIDDHLPAKRLLKIAQAIKPLGVFWICQLKPTKDFNAAVMRSLYASGLRMVAWGVESGNDRVLGLMNKGTNITDIEQVLKDSHAAGVKNTTYIMLGFPTETKIELLDTIGFLERNKENIDLVSASSFGLQNGSEVYNNPEKFGIAKIIEEERTVLGPKISYEVKEGLSWEETRKLRSRYKGRIGMINKFPNEMNFFREHMLCRIVTEEGQI
jgi:hypothetical protein